MSTPSRAVLVSAAVAVIAALALRTIDQRAPNGVAHWSAPDRSGGLHPPPEPELERLLRDAEAIGPAASQEQLARAAEAWRADVAAVNPDWWPGLDGARLLANERRSLARASAMAPAMPITAHVLVIPVEFLGSETLTYQEQDAASQCVTVTRVHSGPTHGQIPYPGASVTETVDNQTVYYSSTEAEDYARLIFGREGYTQPLRAGDPNVNGGAGADISGLTVQTYFDAQSDGTVAITGTVAPWVPNPHSEAWYGIDRCVPNMPRRALPDDQLGSKAELVASAAEALKASDERFASYAFWKQFDGNDDGQIDALWVIHAGRGQEYGGGSEGDAAVWSRANDVGSYEGFPEDGYVIHDNGTAAPEDDVRIGPFAEVPEDSDIGVLIEEFGHSFFDLPDLYVSDATTSNGWWAPMSAGIYGGELAGTRPVNMPLWFRMTAACGDAPCGWDYPMKVLTYTTPSEVVVIGQAGAPAGGSVAEGEFAGETIHEGVRIDLPDQEVVVPNRAGEGGGAFSGAEVGAPHVLSRQLDLGGVTAPLTLTMNAWWQIRAHAGFAHVMVSTDGENYVTLPEAGGRTTAENRYGINRGHGLTGSGSGLLRYDLSQFAGQTCELALLFQDWLGPSSGWWIDDVILPGVFADDFHEGLTAWTNMGWSAVPTLQRFPHYYLVEWRNASGFDESLRSAYVTTYADGDEWRVDRVAANVPGAVVWYRNTRYPFSNSLLRTRDDPPSVGPKWGLLVVDTSFWPTTRPSGRALPGAAESLNAALSVDGQADYTLELRDSAGDLVSTETVSGTRGITRFTDARGYVPGFFQDPALAAATPAPVDADASAVVPSLGGAVYSTRITGPGRSRPHPLDGSGAGPGGQYFGSGDPGDSNLQHGVRVELVGQAADGSWGAVRIVNDAMDYSLSASLQRWVPGVPLTVTVTVANRGSSRARVDTNVEFRRPGERGFSAFSSGWGQYAVGESRAAEHGFPWPVGWPANADADLDLTFRAEFRRSADTGDGFVSDNEVWVRTLALGPPVRVFLPAVRRH